MNKRSAAEAARIRGRAIPRTTCSVAGAVRAVLATASSVAALASAAAFAGPQQGTVVAGGASISTSTPGHTQIDQTTSKAIINWGSFSIGSTESVTFSQPSADSATLNRVTGGSKSVIDGMLSANGQLLILNSAGVLFGRNAQVNVNSLIATTSDIANQDFLDGKLSFHAPGTAVGEVVNEGSIRVADQGLAALVAPTVRNSGVIQARLGRIALASGETFTVDLYGDHLINFAVGQAAGPNSTRRIDQEGSLIADGGKVAISSDAAAGIVTNVVNMSGVIQARTVSQSETGTITLDAPSAAVQVSGTIDASGGAGSVAVLGKSVELTPSGAIEASATQVGSGGSVVLRGSDSIAMSGSVTARGGTASGDGGSVDVSTEGGVALTGAVDVTATHGKSGSLLLDPANITVSSSGSADPTASVVGAPFLNRELQSGTNVSLSATDSITVNAAIDGRPQGGAASSQPSGSVSLTSGSLTIAAPIVTDRAPITLTATGTASGGSGNISFTGSNLTAKTPNSGFLWVADCSTGCTTGTVGNAAIALNAGGNVTADASVSSNGQLASLGAVTIDVGGNLSGLPALNGIATGSGAASGIGSLTVNATGTASLNGAKSNGAIAISASAITTGGSPLLASTGGVTLQAGSGGITVNAAQDANGNSIGVQSGNGGDVVFLTTGTVSLSSNVTAAGNLCIAGALAACSGGQTTPAGAINATSATLQAGSATGPQGITLISSDSISASTLLLGSQGAANLSATNGVTVENPIAGYTGTGSIGSLSVTAGGDVALNGANVGISATNAPAAGAAMVKITSGGNVSLTGAPLIARDAISIDLTGAASGLTVDATSGAGLVAGFGVTSANAVDLTNVLDGTASITVARSAGLSQFNGPIVLKDGLLAAGAVNIGSASAPIGTVCGDAACSTDAAVIQAGADKTGTAAISIFANGQVSASRLLVGESGSVTLDSTGSISVSQPLTGFTGSLGIGSLSATSGQNLTLNGGTIGDSSSVTPGQGTATLTAAGQFTTGGNSLIAREGISITAGSTVTLNPVTGGAALVAGYDAAGAYDAIAGHVPNVQINDATNSASLKINTDGGILSAGDVLIGSGSRVGQVTSLTAPGTIQAGDPTNNPGAAISIFANGTVELGPVLVGPQGSISVNPNDTSSSTSSSVTFDKGLYGFSSGGTQLGIGSLTVDSDGTISIPGVQANQNITITGYTPAAAVHGGFITNPGDVTAANGQGPWRAGGDVQITLDSGDLTFSLPQNTTGNTPFDLAATTGSIDIEGAGQVLSPNGISAGKAVLIGATTPVAGVNIGAVRSSTTGSQDPSIVNATGTVNLGPWMGGQDSIVPSSGLRNAPIAGGVSITGSTITTAGIAGFQTPQDLCCLGVAYITLNGSQGMSVNGLLVSYGVDSATGAGIALYAAPGKTIEVNRSLATVEEDYVIPGGIAITPLGTGGPIVIGDKNGYPLDPQAVAPVKIDLSADVLTINKDITFNGDVTLFSGLALDHASAVHSPFFNTFTSTNPSSEPAQFPDSNFNHITDLLIDPQNNILAQPTEPNLANFYLPPPTQAGAGNDTAGWSKGLGELTAVVNAGMGVGAGNVTFNGNVLRDLPTSLPTAPGAVISIPTTPVPNSCQQPCNVNELTLLPSYVNVALVVHGSSVVFNGATGDPVSAENTVLGVHNPVTDTNGNPIGYVVQASTGGLPALGYFKIDVSGTDSNGNAFSGWSCAKASLCANYVTYDPGLVAGQTPTPNSPPNVVSFYYQFDDTNPGQQDIGLTPTAGTSETPVVVGNIYGTGAFAPNPLQPSAAPGSAASGGVAGSGANGLGSAVLGGADFSVTSETAAAAAAATAEVDGVTTADARRQEDTEGEQTPNTTTDTCPRGAGSTADLGQRPGVSGASPNVFVRCGRTEVAYRAASP